MNDPAPAAEAGNRRATRIRKDAAAPADLRQFRSRLLKTEERLRESEDRFRRLMDAESDAIVLVDADSKRIVDANKAAIRLYGYTRAELLGLSPLDISAEPKKSVRSIERTAKKGHDRVLLRYHKKKDGTVFPIEFADGLFRWRGRRTIYGIFREITERMADEEILKATMAQLTEQKGSLEKKNMALNEVLAQIETEKHMMRKQLAARVEKLLIPVLHRIRQQGGTPDSSAIDVLEANLRSIGSEFDPGKGADRGSLTARELEIAHMVRSGMSSRAIAETARLSVRTVEKHRDNIRRKLDISKKNVNLTTYLRQT